MKRSMAIVVGLVLLAAVGVTVYPSAHGSYVRHRAAAHLRDAETLRDQMSSPVAKQALGGSGDQLRFALMRSDLPVEDIAQFDRELVRLMASLKASPPPDNPIEVTAASDPSVTAGGTAVVRVTVRSILPQAFLVNVTVQVIADSGWRSGPVRKSVDQSIASAPIETTFEIPIALEAGGAARVQAAATYRLDQTGEGMDLLAQSTGAVPLTIVRSGKGK